MTLIAMLNPLIKHRTFMLLMNLYKPQGYPFLRGADPLKEAAL